jgi:putative oxidoreductase
MIRNRIVLFAFRVVVGGLFLYAGALKIVDPLGFAQDIDNYRLVPRAIAFFAALILPWVETLAGAALIAGLFRRTSAGLISLMLVFFILLAAVTMARGLDVDCGCFGALSRKAGWSLLLEDALMLFMAAQLVFSRPRPLPPS